MDTTVLGNVLDSLDIMWKGMLGLFAVCALVALITGLISKAAGGKNGPTGNSAAQP